MKQEFYILMASIFGLSFVMFGVNHAIVITAITATLIALLSNV